MFFWPELCTECVGQPVIQVNDSDIWNKNWRVSFVSPLSIIWFTRVTWQIEMWFPSGQKLCSGNQSLISSLLNKKFLWVIGIKVWCINSWREGSFYLYPHGKAGLVILSLSNEHCGIQHCVSSVILFTWIQAWRASPNLHASTADLQYWAHELIVQWTDTTEKRWLGRVLHASNPGQR